jgi:hypothetical protein
MKVGVLRAYFHCARSIVRANLWQPDRWAEPMKVSFGKIFAEIMNMDASAAPKIDEQVRAGYAPENL